MQDGDLIGLLAELVGQATRAGADAADALVYEQTSLGVNFRRGEPEHVERSEAGDVGLRVLIGRRQASASSSDRSPGALSELVARTVAMARAVPEDPFCGIAEPGQIAHASPDLDLLDPAFPDARALTEMARRGEEAALAVKGVDQVEGSGADWRHSRVALAASNGFAQEYQVGGFSLATSAIAGTSASGMERDWEASSAVYRADLLSPEEVGRVAGERAVRRLGARKVATGRVPVVFDPRAARSLLGHLAGAINGAMIARGTSFLKDRLGRQVLPAGMNVIDDPLRPRGLRSRPWDGEGLPTARLAIVEDGVLSSWFLDLRSARQLGLASQGHASRGTGGVPSPSPSNLWLEPGAKTPAALMADIDQGFYVTELIGMGVNLLTGDYSRGAAGFWIDKGELAYPVSEMTIAGNLREMFMALEAADDLVFRTGMDVPTLRVDGMTVAGVNAS